MEGKKFNSEIVRLSSNVWSFGIPIPKKISSYFLNKDVKRVVVELNNKIKIQVAFMSSGDGSYYFNINKETRKKLGLKESDPLEVSVEKDESKYGLPMPEVFQELLYQEPEIDQYFHSLTPGKQRSLLHIIGKPKSIEIRLKKAMVIGEYLKWTKGKLDFKELNEAFKNA